MNIDPSFAAYLQRAIAERTEPLDRADVAQRRAQVAAARASLFAAMPDAVTANWETIESDGLPLRLLVFRPISAPASLPAVLYCHGGGWVYGSPEQSAELAFLYVQRLGAVVVSPEYRRAPEHPYPAAFHDCYNALLWMASKGREFGVDAARIAVAGESAGGNLAAACALAARDRAGPALVAQILNYPALGLHFDTKSYVENADAPILSRAEMMYFWRAYLGGRLVAADRYAVPLQAEDLSRLPPAHVTTAEYDPLRDDGELYARRLIEAGSAATLGRAPRLTHGFLRALSVSTDAQAMADRICEALSRSFSRPGIH